MKIPRAGMVSLPPLLVRSSCPHPEAHTLRPNDYVTDTDFANQYYIMTVSGDSFQHTIYIIHTYKCAST